MEANATSQDSDADPMAMMQAFASTFMKAMNEMNARQSPAASSSTSAKPAQKKIATLPRIQTIPPTPIEEEERCRDQYRGQYGDTYGGQFKIGPVIKSSPTEMFYPPPPTTTEVVGMRNGYPPSQQLQQQQNGNIRPVARMGPQSMRHSQNRTQNQTQNQSRGEMRNPYLNPQVGSRPQSGPGFGNPQLRDGVIGNVPTPNGARSRLPQQLGRSPYTTHPHQQSKSQQNGGGMKRSFSVREGSVQHTQTQVKPQPQTTQTQMQASSRPRPHLSQTSLPTQAAQAQAQQNFQPQTQTQTSPPRQSQQSQSQTRKPQPSNPFPSQSYTGSNFNTIPPIIPSIEPIPQTQLIQPWRHPPPPSTINPTNPANQTNPPKTTFTTIVASTTKITRQTPSPTSITTSTSTTIPKRKSISITRTSSLSSLSSISLSQSEPEDENEDDNEQEEKEDNEQSLFLTKSPSLSSRPLLHGNRKSTGEERKGNAVVEVQIPISSDLLNVRVGPGPPLFPGLMRNLVAVNSHFGNGNGSGKAGRKVTGRIFGGMNHGLNSSSGVNLNQMSSGVNGNGNSINGGVKKRRGPIPSRPLSGPPPKKKKKNKPTVVRLKEENEFEFERSGLYGIGINHNDRDGGMDDGSGAGWYEDLRGGKRVIVIDDSEDESSSESQLLPVSKLYGQRGRETNWIGNSTAVILDDDENDEDGQDDGTPDDDLDDRDIDDDKEEEEEENTTQTRDFVMQLSDNSEDSDYLPQEPSHKRLRAIERDNDGRERDKRHRVEELSGWIDAEPGREEFEEILGMASRAAGKSVSSFKGERNAGKLVLENGFGKRLGSELTGSAKGSKEVTPSIGGLAIPSVIWNREKLHRVYNKTRHELDDKVRLFDRANSGVDTENEGEELSGGDGGGDEEDEESLRKRVQQYIDENENFYAPSDDEIAKAAVDCQRAIEECEKVERGIKERVWRQVENEARNQNLPQEKHYLRHEWPEHPLIRPYLSSRLSSLPVEITRKCTLASLTRTVHTCTAQPPIPIRTLSYSCLIKDIAGETLVVKINTGLEETFSKTQLYNPKGPLSTHILTAMNRLESHGVHPPPPRNTDARHSNSRYNLAKEYWASKGMPCGVFYFACWRPLGHFRAHFSKTAGSFGHSLSKDILGEHGWDFGVRVRYLADMTPIHQAISLWFEAIDQERYSSYRELVDKLSEADTGLDAVRFTNNQSFIALATLRNMQARNHKDKTNVTDGWAGMTCTGSFTGGEICLPDLNLNLTFLPGDVIFFRSSLLQHFVRRFIGNRSSLIFFTQTDPKQPLVQNARFSEMGSKEWEVISERRKADIDDEASRKEKMREYEGLEPYPTEEKDLTPWKLKMARRRKARFVGFARKEVEAGGGVTEEDVHKLEEMQISRFYELNLVELNRWKRGCYPFASMKDDDGKRVRKRKR